MTTSLTTVYLDIDGVLMVLRPHGDSPWDGEYLSTQHSGDSMAVSQRLVERVNSLARRPDIRMVFCTSWSPRTLPELEEVGLESSSCPILRWDRTPSVKGEDWKHTAVKADQSGVPSRFLWIEDDLCHPSAAPVHEWIKATGRGGWLAPNWVTGLTPDLMDRVEDALERRMPLEHLHLHSCSPWQVKQAEQEWLAQRDRSKA